MENATPKLLLKDQLFNIEKITYLAGLFAGASNKFDQQAFIDVVMGRLLDLELKQRIDWIAEVLGQFLPDDFPSAAVIILKALPAPCDPSLGDDDFGDFIFSPLGEYVVTHGIDDNLDLSLDLFEAITQRFSMEYAIRSFLNRWPNEVLARMEIWASHPHYHVRRLVSEGTRPKLPWGIRLDIDPMMALPLLDQLYADDTRFVTRSVANHLNDIAKIDQDTVVERLAVWQTQSRQSDKEMNWITRHALRTLIKKGHAGALEMLGFRRDAPVTAKVRLSKDQYAIGDMLSFHVELSAEIDVPVLVDYVIWFQKKNGQQSPKVFKLKRAVVKAGDRLHMEKSYRLKKESTTLPLFVGEHRLEIQVNGVVLHGAPFELVDG